MQPVGRAKRIFEHVNKAPGIRYRELLRLTGLANGVLSYHLKKLEKSKLVKVKKLRCNMTRYYPIAVKGKESDILDYILPSTKRKIMFFLLENDKCTFKEIVHHVKKAPSTIYSHLKNLKDAGIVSVLRHDNQTYRLKNKRMIARIISKYKRRL